MMKWVAGVLAALVLAVVAVAVVGALIPTEHVARVSMTLNQPADSVWHAIRDLGSYPDWWPDVESMERLPDRESHEVWLQSDPHGQAMPLMVWNAEPPHRLTTVIIAQNLPFGGTWTHEIEPTPDGCQITSTEAGQIYNPYFRFLARFVFGYHRTLESYLRALAQRFGEEPLLTRDAGS